MDYLSDDFYKEFYTDQDDLGWTFTASNSTFKVWVPLAEKVTLTLYQDWRDESPIQTIPLKKKKKGVWEGKFSGNLHGQWYLVETVHGGESLGPAIDPYARAVSPNGLKGFIVDLYRTSPEGWDHDQSPAFDNPAEAVVYEVHTRDVSSLDNSGNPYRGKFKGLTARGTRSHKGYATGFDHLLELKPTHVQLLPIFDYDEADDLGYNPEDYNWGYNPRNYNALKGAYNTNPEDPAQGIREFKEVVQEFHRHGMRLVMDVVYNHTYSTYDSNLNKIFPGYYYRQYEGVFSDGSGCGNELASERPMVRKMILDSLKYWVREYHLDGFRFDLMGLHDVETMNLIYSTFKTEDPGFMLYGEGWTGGLSPLPENQRALKANAASVPGIGFFSDDSRDAIKGHVFDEHKKGFVNGGHNMEDSLKFGIVACTGHPQIEFSNLLYSSFPWATSPLQTVTYAAVHDNNTLWDKLKLTSSHLNESEREKMHKLAAAIVLTSQGIPCLHAGMEFLRTKQLVENSYNSPDKINGIDWSLKEKHLDVMQYFEGLIALRKTIKAFSLTTTEKVVHHLQFLELAEPNMVAFWLLDHAGGSKAEKVMVVYNANGRPREVHLTHDDWRIVVNHEKAGVHEIDRPKNNMVILPGRSCMVLITADGL
jgi:pullulanase